MWVGAGGGEGVRDGGIVKISQDKRPFLRRYNSFSRASPQTDSCAALERRILFASGVTRRIIHLPRECVTGGKDRGGRGRGLGTRAVLDHPGE